MPASTHPVWQPYCSSASTFKRRCRFDLLQTSGIFAAIVTNRTPAPITLDVTSVASGAVDWSHKKAPDNAGAKLDEDQHVLSVLAVGYRSGAPSAQLGCRLRGIGR